LGRTEISGLAEFGYVYNLAGQTIALEADVVFDSNGILTPWIIHAPGTSQIVFASSDNYKVAFSLSTVGPSQFAAFLNGVAIEGATYGSGAGTQQNNGQVIVAVLAGDFITIRNHSSAAAIAIQDWAGGTQANTNASVLIEKLD
jgi:hypothetical protein